MRRAHPGVHLCARARPLKLRPIKLTKARARLVPRGHRAGAAHDARGEGEAPVEAGQSQTQAKTKPPLRSNTETDVAGERQMFETM